MSLDILLEQDLKCAECASTDTILWHRSDANEIVCDICNIQRRESVTRSTRSQGSLSLTTAATIKDADESRTVDGTTSLGPAAKVSSTSGITRKSHRLRPLGKSKQSQNVVKPSSTKGRGRRLIFKKNPMKAPVSVATIVTKDYIFFEGSYWQIGDVVSVTDVDDGQTYYAQLRGFLEDQYCNKSAVITWLVPKLDFHHNNQTKRAPDFNLAAYTAGPEEDLPRDMAHFEFVCHAPLDYYTRGSSSHRSYAVRGPPIGCIWTSLGPEIQTLKSCTTSDSTVNSEVELQPRKSNSSVSKVDSRNSAAKKMASLKEKTRSHKASAWANRGKDRKQ